MIDIYPRLPRKVRLRLMVQRQIDDAAYWLICHDHLTAARLLWQATGGW